mgnify:CR=1 FL=1
MTWKCRTCFTEICNSRLWCPRCQERLSIDDRKFSDCYACKIWIHPYDDYPEIYDIMGPLDENLTWEYLIDEEDYFPEHVIWWYAKITKWGEIIEGRGDVDMAIWFDELDSISAIECYYSDLQVFRENVLVQP